MEGPPTILDKSAFQALSYTELAEFRKYFLENVTPVLILEILGDLKKQYRDGTVPEEKVTELAGKFGFGEWLNEDRRFICEQTLLGTAIPLVGKVVPAYATVVDGEEGSAALIEDGPLNHLIRRLASRKATEADRQLAARWRSASQSLSLTGLNEFVNHHQILVPRVRTPAEAVQAARGLVDTGALQKIWLAWLLDHLGVNARTGSEIVVRWRARGGLLRSFAPYAHYCLHAQLSLFVAWRSNVVGWKPTNILDLEYVYYLPFCSVFVSDDKLHRVLVPSLLRPDQLFVRMQDFKAGLRQTRKHFEDLPEGERIELRKKLYNWPPEGSIIRELWIKNERWVGPPPPPRGLKSRPVEPGSCTKASLTETASGHR